MQYTFALSRRSLPVRCLCLLLVVLVLWCFFAMPRAGAVALEAATAAYSAALVGAILVGAGVVFASHGDMQAVGAAMVRSWQQSNDAIGSKIAALSSWALEHGGAAAKGALRVGKELYQGIVDTFNAVYSAGKFEISPSVSAAQDFVSSNRSVQTFYIHTYYYDYGTYDMGLMRWYKVVWSSTSSRVQVRVTDLVDDRVITTSSTGVNGVLSSCFLDIVKERDYTYLALRRIGTYSDGQAFDDYTEFDPYIRDDFFELSASAPVSISCSGGDLAYPSDDYLVKMPDLPAVDDVTGSVAWPSDAAYTKDAVAMPYPVDSDAIKVPDIPYDIPVDQSTGKALDDTGTDTDKPGTDTGEGTGTDTGGLLGQIISLLKNFFDGPSDFKLNFDGFENLILPERFPFCIPFDLINSVKIFAVTAVSDFVFRIDLDTSYWSIHHAVDLAPFTLVITFFRYAAVAGWVWFLINRTRSLIKW